MAKQTVNGSFKQLTDGQHPYPSVAEMRDSQRVGSEGCGLPENCVDALNEAQGHNVSITDDKGK